MAYGDFEVCGECIFGIDGASTTCDECEMGDCFSPAEEDCIRDKKLNLYLMTPEAA